MGSRMRYGRTTGEEFSSSRMAWRREEVRKNSEGGVRWEEEGEGVWDMVGRCVGADIAESYRRKRRGSDVQVGEPKLPLPCYVNPSDSVVIRIRRSRKQELRYVILF